MFYHSVAAAVLSISIFTDNDCDGHLWVKPHILNVKNYFHATMGRQKYQLTLVNWLGCLYKVCVRLFRTRAVA